MTTHRRWLARETGWVLATIAFGMMSTSAQDAAAQDTKAGGVVYGPPDAKLVRLRITSREGTWARLFHADGSNALLCDTPCSKDLPPGVALRVILGRSCENGEAGHCDANGLMWEAQEGTGTLDAAQKNVQTYVVPDSPGQEVDVTVGPPSASRNTAVLGGGILVLALGTGLGAWGVVTIADSSSSRYALSGFGTIAGAGIVALGVGLMASGIVLIVTGRSARPTVNADLRKDHAEGPRVRVSADAGGIGLTF